MTRSEFSAGYELGRVEERAAIVAFVRTLDDEQLRHLNCCIADRIERGEHVSDNNASPDDVISDNRSAPSHEAGLSDESRALLHEGIAQAKAGMVKPLPSAEPLREPCSHCERYMRAWLAMEMKPVQERAETFQKLARQHGADAVRLEADVVAARDWLSREFARGKRLEAALRDMLVGSPKPDPEYPDCSCPACRAWRLLNPTRMVETKACDGRDGPWPCCLGAGHTGDHTKGFTEPKGREG